MNERILSYSMSQKLTEEELDAVSGGSFQGTGQPPLTGDLRFDF